jgi:hypothetical protein
MDGRIQRSKHRHSTEPFVASDGHVIERDIRDSDYDIMALHKHFRVISARWAAACLTRSEQGVSRRYRSLKEDGVGIFRICEPQKIANSSRGYIYYDITETGVQKAADHGIYIDPPKLTTANLDHAVFAQECAMSFYIGTLGREIAIEFHKKTRLVLGKDEYKKEVSIIGDFPHFDIKRADGAICSIPSFEADTGKMPIKTYDRERSGIANKFRKYITAIEGKMYEDQFGVKIFYIPFVTRSEARMHSMMKCLEEMTEDKPRLRKQFLFKWEPHLKPIKAYDEEKRKWIYERHPLPTGKMLTEPWFRVEKPALQLDL